MCQSHTIEQLNWMLWTVEGCRDLSSIDFRWDIVYCDNPSGTVAKVCNQTSGE